jgi:hypothetical protein
MRVALRYQALSFEGAAKAKKLALCWLAFLLPGESR